MEAKIAAVWVDSTKVNIKTEQGEVFSEYFDDYVRLRYATQQQRENFTCDPFGIHWEEIDEDLSYAGFMQKKPENSIYKTFKAHPELNVSSVARIMGIRQSLMASYIGGSKNPSEERKKQIEKTLHEIAASLAAVKIA